MSKEIDWSKAPEGATHWVGGNEPWHKHIGDTSWYWQESQQKWYQLRICASDVEDEYRETIVKKPEQSWTGQGLPPVGTVCEFMWNYLASGSEYVTARVIAHDEKKAVVRIVSGEHGGSFRESSGGSCGDSRHEQPIFRPIRTQAQIEAEERESHVLAMLCYDALGGTRRGLAEALYDAGYRKTEAGK